MNYSIIFTLQNNIIAYKEIQFLKSVNLVYLLVI